MTELNREEIRVTISNSAGWVITTNTGAVSNIVQIASGFALIGTINTIAIGGGNTVTVVNSGGLFAQQSGPWTVAVSNTGGAFTLANSSALSAIITNSQNWVIYVQQSGSWSQANTVNAVNVINSAGWVVAVSNTSPLVSIQNSAGWVFAQSNTSGQAVFATLESAQMSSSGVILTPLFAVISVSATDNTIVAAVSNKAIRVLAMDMMAFGPVNGRFLSGIGGAALTGYAFMGASGGIVRPFNPVGWFQTATSTLLDLNLSSAQSVGGCITYVTV